jgi:prepilin-type N-terminal cleavage/methylation domain-containing protein
MLTPKRLITRLRAEDDGFTLIELLASMVIGGVVLTALMTVFVTGVRSTTEIQNRVDDAGRARYALDRIVRLLDSQVCYVATNSDIGTPPVFAASTNNSATFLADLTGASGNPNKYTITYVPAAGATPGKLTVDTYSYNATTKAWTTKVGATSTLVSDIVPAKVGGVAQPIFTYYTYVPSSWPDKTVVGDVSGTPATTPLSTTDAPNVVKVGVQFAAVSSTSHLDNAQHAWVKGSGTLSTFNADPTAPSACS